MVCHAEQVLPWLQPGCNRVAMHALSRCRVPFAHQEPAVGPLHSCDEARPGGRHHAGLGCTYYMVSHFDGIRPHSLCVAGQWPAMASCGAFYTLTFTQSFMYQAITAAMRLSDTKAVQITKVCLQSLNNSILYGANQPHLAVVVTNLVLV